MQERTKKGLAQLARDLGENSGNLFKVLRGKRKPSRALVVKVKASD